MSTYKQKLRDPRWNEVRKAVLARDNYACVQCHQDTIKMHVHHTYYDLNLEPWEYPEDSLITLCENCHEEHHRTDRRLNKLIIDSMNKCGLDTWGKLYLAAAFETKSYELREQRELLGPMEVFSVCLTMFEPGLTDALDRGWDVTARGMKGHYSERMFQSIYQKMLEENRRFIDGE